MDQFHVTIHDARLESEDGPVWYLCFLIEWIFHSIEYNQFQQLNVVKKINYYYYYDDCDGDYDDDDDYDNEYDDDYDDDDDVTQSSKHQELHTSERAIVPRTVIF